MSPMGTFEGKDWSKELHGYFPRRGLITYIRFYIVDDHNINMLIKSIG